LKSRVEIGCTEKDGMPAKGKIKEEEGKKEVRMREMRGTKSNRAHG
jgi:hypothetical protein